MSFEIYFGISIILIVAIWASIYIIKRTKENNNEHLFDFIPHLFPTLGILFTFLGIAIGLWNFDSNDIEKSIPELMNGLKTAFLVSIFGVSLLVVFSFWTNIKKKELEKDVISQETRAIQELTTVLKELRTDMNSLDNNHNKVSLGDNIKSLILNVKQIKSSLNVQDDNGNEILLGNVLRDIYSENLKQSNSLQSFSSDLAITIEAGFQKILNDPSEGVVAELKLVKNEIENLNKPSNEIISELKLLKLEIENLGNKLKDPATDMTQSIVKELQESMGKMIEEFKTTMSGDTKNEMERLAELISNAGNSLSVFPEKLEKMTDQLQENFTQLQQTVKVISENALQQSNLSTGEMKKQVEELSVSFKNNISSLQNEQKNLIKSQGESVSETNLLISNLNKTISILVETSQEISESTQDFKDIQEITKDIYSNINKISSKVLESSEKFSSSQLGFSKYANEFLQNNSKTITDFQEILNLSKTVSADYAQKFEIIERGLQGIFSQIHNGLEEYKIAIGKGIETILGEYTQKLTKATENLASATEMQSESIKELEEEIKRLKS